MSAGGFHELKLYNFRMRKIRNLDAQELEENSSFFGSRPNLIAILSLNLVAATLLFLQLRRDPWADEIWTFHFINHPGLFFERVAGDPHPIGYYMIAMLVYSVMASMASDAVSLLDIWILLKFAVFVCSIAIFSVLTLIFSWTEIRDRPTKLRIFLVVLPSLIIFASAFGSATDLRSYGAQAAAAVILCSGIYLTRNSKLSTGQLCILVFALALLGTLDVWATLLAFYIFWVAFYYLSDSRLRLFVLGATVAAPLI